MRMDHDRIPKMQQTIVVAGVISWYIDLSLDTNIAF